jgi:hypothetical protein
MDFLTTQVERMLSDRRPFDEIEDRIEGMSVPDDKKAALWLLAWSGQAEWVRRRTVAEVLTSTAAPFRVRPDLADPG